MSKLRILLLWCTAIIIFCLCLVAANWQYDRHVVRDLKSSEMDRAYALPVANLKENLLNESIFQPVRISGRFTDESSLIRKRPYDGRNGFWVVAQFQADFGGRFAVLQGWIPADRSATSVVTNPAKASKRVIIEGNLREFESQSDASDLPLGQEANLSKNVVDNDQKFFIHLTTMDTWILESQIWTVPLPRLGNGPHLFYAYQWVIFGLIALIGAAYLNYDERTKR